MQRKGNRQEGQELFDLDVQGGVKVDYAPAQGKIESKPIYLSPADDMSWLEEPSDDELAERVATERDCSKDMVCWQYLKRKQFIDGNANEQIELMPEDISLELNETILRQIPREVAKQFIEKYEWLGTLGPFKFGYGLYFGYKLGGVACFSPTTTWQAEVSICGEEYRDRVILLSRGAAAHWTPPNTSSYLISQALKVLERDTPYRIVLAYSDIRAGEVGTVYQATNWLFIGLGATGFDHVPLGLADTTSVRFHTRGLPKELKSARRIKEAGMEVARVARANKCRYIFFLGSKKERKELLQALRWRSLPYPTREDFMKVNWHVKFRARPKRGF